MSIKIEEIIDAKNEAGLSAFLWMHDAGDCILWPDEESSVDDDGAHAISRWRLTKDEVLELKDSGIIDLLA